MSRAESGMFRWITIIQALLWLLYNNIMRLEPSFSIERFQSCTLTKIAKMYTFQCMKHNFQYHGMENNIIIMIAYYRCFHYKHLRNKYGNFPRYLQLTDNYYYNIIRFIDLLEKYPTRFPTLLQHHHHNACMCTKL